MTKKVLVDQPSKMPTRKMIAMMIAFVVTNVVKGLLEMYFPDTDFTSFLLQFNVYIEAMIIFATGYFVRNRSVV